jgi:hypothetical protein
MPGATARQPLKKGISKKPKQPLRQNKTKEDSNYWKHVVEMQEEETSKLNGMLDDPALTTNQKLEAVNAMLQRQTQIR